VRGRPADPVPALPPVAQSPAGPAPARRPRYRDQVWAGPLLVGVTFVVLVAGLIATERALLNELLESQVELLSGQVQTAADRLESELRAAEVRVDRLRRTIETSTPPPSAADEGAFRARFARRDDGTWRPRLERFAPAREAGGWVPDPPSAATRHFVLHTKRVLDTLGFATITTGFEDVWAIPRQGGEIILYPADPSYVWQQDPATDYTASAWLQLASPERNPGRDVRWTPPILATSNSEWYVSVLAPVWLHGAWAGSVGQDLTIGRLVDELTRTIQDAGGWVAVLGPGRQVLFSTAHRTEMARAAGQFGLDTLGLGPLGPALDVLERDLAAPGARSGAAARHDLAAAHLIASRVDPGGWTLLGVLPRATIAAAIVRSVQGTRLFVGAGMVALLAVSLIVLNREVRRRRRSEEATRESELWFSRLFDLLPDGVAITVPESGAIVEANDGLSRLTGHPREALIGATTVGLGLWADPAQRQEVLQGIARHDAVQNVPARLRRADGDLMETLYSGRLIDVGGRRLLLSVVRDVSAQRRLEEQLAQAQRLEAVGRLAGGVAHDFNNLITAIAGYAELLRDSLPPDDPRRDDTGEILQSARRGAELTSQLLGFARRQIVQPRIVDVDQVIRPLARMLERLLGADVELVIEAAPAVPPVRVDPGQLEQVVTNLAVNARDAMPAGGRLRLRVDAGDGEVVLSATDTGHGIRAEDLPHIFEPFFTTKEQGRGTGLGLATCYGIVQQAGGRIEVDSEPGRGTTFRVILPAAGPAPPVVSPRGAQPQAPTGHEAILVVEDEPQVRQVLARTLASLGYDVTVTASGDEALGVAAARPRPFDLVVTDVVMPGMSGLEVVRALRARWPDLPALVLSGYTDDRFLRDDVEGERLPFLQKPFTRDALAAEVRRLLEGRGAPSG
jgi:PAS domain S-box-containing protein